LAAINLNKRLLGRYLVGEELGRGAMGVVHKASDPSLGRTVAIKAVKLSADASDAAEYEARFYQEAKAAGSLNHPGIITIYDAGREDDWAYIAMEYLDGEELRDLLAKGRMPLATVLDIAAQVASALDFAHERGVVHRDIKPGNIMVLRDGKVKIMDFGIARMRVSAVKTRVGMLLGSPKYMSPEQVIGRRMDHRSDIFSLGVVLFEMTAGMAPFSGNDMAELMHAVVNTQQTRPSQMNPAAPGMLDLIVAKALQKDADLRYQSAREMAEDLVSCRAALGDEASAPLKVGEDTLPFDIEATVPNHLAVADNTITQRLSEAPQNFSRFDDVADTDIEATMRLGGDRTLQLSRRHNFSKALMRLAQAPEDTQNANTTPVPHAQESRLFKSPQNVAVAAMLGVAIVGAVAIALL
jgi:eukaryotic-like serine/threonine-protein kinase